MARPLRTDAEVPEEYRNEHWLEAGKSRYETGVGTSETQACIEVLDDWFWAMQEDTAKYRKPDPYYEVPPGRPAWTDDRVNKLIFVIDEYLDAQVLGAPGSNPEYGGWAGKGNSSSSRSPMCDAGSDFRRLELEQRYALAQDLEREMWAVGAWQEQPVVDTGGAPYYDG